MRVLVLAPFSSESLEELREEAEVIHESWLETGVIQDPEELGERLRSDGFDAVVVEADFLLAETFSRAPRLRFAGICRSATNQIDTEAATKLGIAVVNTPGRNANAVAEHTLALMLAVSRRVAEADKFVRGRRWELPTQPYTRLRGVELGGKTVGIVGLGAIGRRVAELCNGFDMNVLAYDPLVTPRQAQDAGAVWSDLPLLLESSDFITLHAPPLPGGTLLLDSALMARIKEGAFLINTASADLVDHATLVRMLQTGTLGGAGLDIFRTHPVEPSDPLLDLENVVLTPHIAGATEDTVARHSASMAVDLIRFKAGKRPFNMVNSEVWEHRRE